MLETETTDGSVLLEKVTCSCVYTEPIKGTYLLRTGQACGVGWCRSDGERDTDCGCGYENSPRYGIEIVVK